MRGVIRLVLLSGKICKTILLGVIVVAIIIPGSGPAFSQSSSGSSLFTFTAINVSGLGTFAYGINNTGQIVGWYGTNSVSYGFLRSPEGTISTFAVPYATFTYPSGINGSGQIVGYYLDALTNAHGFFRDAQGTITTLDFPGAYPAGINDAGQIVGGLVNASGGHGFLRDAGGTITAFDFPGAHDTTASGINGTGQIVGWYHDISGNLHGFLRAAGGTSYTRIDVPGATSTIATGINNSGQIVGTINDTSGTHGFLRDVGGTFTTIDGPGAGPNGTIANGINDSGLIVGYWYDTVGIGVHGFVTGKPDPVLKVPHWYQAGIPGKTDTNGFTYPTCSTCQGNFWARDPYDSIPLSPPPTIQQKGCALTALTTVANFWAGHLDDPTGFSPYGLDPRQMNLWKGLYAKGTQGIPQSYGDIKWNNFAIVTDSGATSVRLYPARSPSPNPCTTTPPNNSFPVYGSPTSPDANLTLDNLLRNGVAVILPILGTTQVTVIVNNVPSQKTVEVEKHWVVITGKASHVQIPSGSYVDTYLVNDPGDKNVEALDTFTTTDSQGHVTTHLGVAGASYAIGDGITAASVKNSLLRYMNWKVFVGKDPATKTYKVINCNDPSTAQALGIYSSDPVEFVLTDPQGRRTGFDPVSNTSFQEIPTSAYSTAIYRDEQDFSTPDPPPFKSLDMANQMDGQYTLNVIGTGSASFTVEVTSSDAAGNWITQTYSGMTAPGVTSRVTFQGTVTTFAAFGVNNLAISPSYQAFGMNGTFSLGLGGTISPVTQPLTIQVGTFLATIPAGSFTQTPQGTFTFGGVIQGVLLAAALTPTGGNSYAFAIAAAGAPNLPSANPVDVRLAIDNNGGSTSVNATFVP